MFSREVMVHEHLSFNLIPPMVELKEFALLAIEAAANGEWDKEIIVEKEGNVERLTSRFDGHVATARDIVDGLRLENFVQNVEDFQ